VHLQPKLFSKKLQTLFPKNETRKQKVLCILKVHCQESDISILY
jgi:hypothetical protein